MNVNLCTLNGGPAGASSQAINVFGQFVERGGAAPPQRSRCDSRALPNKQPENSSHRIPTFAKSSWARRPDALRWLQAPQEHLGHHRDPPFLDAGKLAAGTRPTRLRSRNAKPASIPHATDVIWEDDQAEVQNKNSDGRKMPVKPIAHMSAKRGHSQCRATAINALRTTAGMAKLFTPGSSCRQAAAKSHAAARLRRSDRRASTTARMAAT